MQDGSIVIGSRLLYYIKSMPIAVFSNICTSISLMYKIRYQVINIILDDNDIFNIW